MGEVAYMPKPSRSNAFWMLKSGADKDSRSNGREYACPPSSSSTSQRPRAPWAVRVLTELCTTTAVSPLKPALAADMWCSHTTVPDAGTTRRLAIPGIACTRRVPCCHLHELLAKILKCKRVWTTHFGMILRSECLWTQQDSPQIVCTLALHVTSAMCTLRTSLMKYLVWLLLAQVIIQPCDPCHVHLWNVVERIIAGWAHSICHPWYVEDHTGRPWHWRYTLQILDALGLVSEQLWCLSLESEETRFGIFVTEPDLKQHAGTSAWASGWGFRPDSSCFTF